MALAGTAAVLAYLALPDDLDVSTDIVGVSDLREFQHPPVLLGIWIAHRLLPAGDGRALLPPHARVRRAAGPPRVDSVPTPACPGGSRSGRTGKSPRRCRPNAAPVGGPRTGSCDRRDRPRPRGLLARRSRIWRRRVLDRLGCGACPATRRHRPRERPQHHRGSHDGGGSLLGVRVHPGDGLDDRRGAPLSLASSLARGRGDRGAARVALPGPCPSQVTVRAERARAPSAADSSSRRSLSSSS